MEGWDVCSMGEMSDQSLVYVRRVEVGRSGLLMVKDWS